MSYEEALKYFHKILNGDLNKIPERKPKVVSIFLSSTFSDTHEERNYFIKNVYPNLKKFCKNEYDLDFQIIDLRWGISNEIKLIYRTTFCIEEVKRCLKNSTKPSFVTLLSHRYGSIFLPSQISKNAFEAIHNEIKTRDRDVLNYRDPDLTCEDIFEHCFKLDFNSMPLYYNLLDLSFIFDNYDEKNKTYEIKWNKLEEHLKKIFQDYSIICYEKSNLTKEEKDHFFVSVTEEEVFAGLLEIENPETTSLAFIREIENYDKDDMKKSKILKRFIDSEHNSISLLKELKQVKIPKKLAKSNIYSYSVDWNIEQGISPQTHREYFDKISSDLENGIKRLVTQSMNKPTIFDHLSSMKQKDLLKEVLSHVYFCIEATQKFQPRDDLIKKVSNYIQSDSKYPLVVYGESGSGKTSIIAKVFHDFNSYFGKNRDFTVILRFLGTTPHASSIQLAYISIINQLSELFGLNKDNIENLEGYDVKQLKELLINSFTLIETKFPNKEIIIFMDSIDQLNKKDYLLDWFLRENPKNVKFIYSTLVNNEKENKEENEVFSRIQAFNFPSENYIKIDELTKQDSLDIMETLCKINNRRLSDGQMKIISDLFDKATLYPLYVDLIFDLTIDWCSYSIIDEDFKKLFTIDDCIRYLFKHLEETYGELLVSRCIFYLTYFKSGISDNELEDVLSIDDELLTHIFEYHEPPVRRFPLALWNRIKTKINKYITRKEADHTEVNCWYHRRFFEVAKELYIDTLSTDQLNNLCINVINYFNESFKDKPKSFVYNPIVAAKKNLKNAESSAIRYTTAQPIKFITHKGDVRFNMRRLNKILEFCNNLQLYTDTRYKTMLDEIFLNYNFIKALFENSFDVFSYCFHGNFRNECYKILEKKDQTTNLSLLILIQFIYICNSYHLNKYPESFGLQICSRILNLYGLSDMVDKFIDECYADSFKTCALVAPFQLLPMSSGNIRLVKNFNRKIHDNIGSGIDYILTDRIEVFSWIKGDKCEIINEFLLPDIISDKFYKLHLYESSKTTDNIFAVSGRKNIASLKINGSINFLKTFTNETIEKTCLIGKHFLLVLFQETNHFDLIDLYTGEEILREKVDANIKVLSINRHEKLTWTDKNNQEDLYISVILENKKLRIYKLVFNFETEKRSATSLKLIHETKPFIFDIISSEFSMNCFDESRKLSEKYLIITLENGECFLIEFDTEKLRNISMIRHDLVEDKHHQVRLVNIGRFIDGFIRMAEPKKALHLYDIIKKKWIMIPGDFGTIKIRFLKNDLLILNYKDNFFDLYRIFNYANVSEEINEFKIVRMIQSYCFPEKIVDLALRDTSAAFAYLANGNLVEVDTESIVLAENQTNIAQLSSVSPENIKFLKPDKAFVYNPNRSIVELWNVSTGKTIQNFDSSLTEILDLLICESVIYIIGFEDTEKTNVSIRGYIRNMEFDLKQPIDVFRTKINVRARKFRFSCDIKNNRLTFCYQTKQKNIDINIFTFKKDDLKWENREILFDYKHVNELEKLDSAVSAFNVFYLQNIDSLIVYLNSQFIVVSVKDKKILSNTSMRDLQNGSFGFTYLKSSQNFLCWNNTTLNYIKYENNEITTSELLNGYEFKVENSIIYCYKNGINLLEIYDASSLESTRRLKKLFEFNFKEVF